MKSHDDYEELLRLKPAVQEFQDLATKHGIADIFQDNGGKLLELLLLTGLKGKAGREGNDAVDEQGQEYELKTMNAGLVSNFSTHHHMNLDIIEKYRQVPWVFGIYKNIELVSAYLVPANGLKDRFDEWEAKINATKARLEADGKTADMNAISINNPKINASMVEKVGKLFYGVHYSELRKTFKTNKNYGKGKSEKEQTEIEI
ncbi:MAG: restriction endonuclease [Pseudomonadota bacterium]